MFTIVACIYRLIVDTFAQCNLHKLWEDSLYIHDNTLALLWSDLVCLQILRQNWYTINAVVKTKMETKSFACIMFFKPQTLITMQITFVISWISIKWTCYSSVVINWNVFPGNLQNNFIKMFLLLSSCLVFVMALTVLSKASFSFVNTLFS